MSEHGRRQGGERTGGRRPRIVAGVDGSPGSRAALVHAFTAAARSGAEVDVVSAYPLTLAWTGIAAVEVPDADLLRTDTQTRAAGFLAEVRAELAGSLPGVQRVPVRLTVAAGPAAPVLVERSRGAALLVVGSRGRGAVRSALLGSVALHCVSHAHCPVTVVHERPAPAEGPARVVVGVDGSAASRAAFRAGVCEAVRLGAAVEVVAAYTFTDFWAGMYPVTLPPLEDVEDEVRARADEVVQAVLAELEPRLGGRLPRVRILVAQAPAADALIDRARGAQLLVAGSRGHGALRGLLLGSVALRCAMHAPCPTMLVPPTRDPAELARPVALVGDAAR